MKLIRTIILEDIQLIPSSLKSRKAIKFSLNIKKGKVVIRSKKNRDLLILFLIAINRLRCIGLSYKLQL